MRETFEALINIIPKEFGYRGVRTRRPPKDLFNATISFGYNYLKYLIERKLLLLGINPYYGILHQENDKVYPFFVFDLMEGLRHSFVDRIVINLISKRELNVDKHSRRFKDAVYLNKFGMKLIYYNFRKELQRKFDKQFSKEINLFLKTYKTVDVNYCGLQRHTIQPNILETALAISLSCSF